MKRIRREHGRKADDYRNQKTTWIIQQNSSKSSKSKNLFPKPIKITQCNGEVGVGCFDSSIWQGHISSLLDWLCKTTIKWKFRISPFPHLFPAGNRCSISAKKIPFPFRKFPFLFPYFHSVFIFPRKSRKVSAPLSSLNGTTACVSNSVRSFRKYCSIAEPELPELNSGIQNCYPMWYSGFSGSGYSVLGPGLSGLGFR
jgi:hypothetical protein